MANYLFFRIFAPVFLLEQSFVSIYNKVRARKKRINKKQDIFMDKKIKALFFDIDGTLVSFKSHRIPQSTVDALEQAKKNGV